MNSGCRLCGSNIMLQNIFELPIQDSQQMRKCIELATGLSILREDEMGEFVCKPCCDVAILCFKYRRNAQKNAIRIRDALLALKTNIRESPSTSSNTTIIKCNISSSTSAILLRYPSLIIPAELYTKNITPVVKLQDITTQPSYQEIESTSRGPKRYRITKLNTTKLCLKKLEAHAQNTKDIHNENYNTPDIDVANITHNSNVCKDSETDKSLLVPITNKVMCNMCNTTFKGTWKLNLHLRKYHKIIKRRICKRKLTKRKGRKGRLPPKHLVLKLVPLEQDNEIKRNYPNVFVNNHLNISNSNNSDCLSANSNGDCMEVSIAGGFKSQWLPGPTRHEKRLIEKSMRSVLETHMTKRRLQIKSVLNKDVGVQATTQLDEKYILDIMGSNEMDVVSQDLSLYNVPVSFLKQSQLKDTTAFFIQYAATNEQSKPIDWSKLKKIDLQRQIGQTSTPLRSTKSHNDLLFTNSQPSTISLGQFTD